MSTLSKLAILADAAKYDASCASSGTSARNSVGGKGIGSTEGMGICHSYAPDGRCISLLKILLTNYCQYDCLYCVNRVSSNVPRARFSVQEVVDLTLDFYRRNCIEGLFLSSGIIQNPDYTMERVVEVARALREDHDFRGYIHLKTIPDAAPELLERAGRYADRLSINIELPTSQGLAALAPERTAPPSSAPWAAWRCTSTKHGRRGRSSRGGAPARSASSPLPGRARRAEAPRFAPGGQSTQMIVGADGADDRTILATSARLYGGFGLRRVYYSAFSPIPDAPRALPLAAPPLVREHRLYQADWLMRFYGFTHDEIVPPAPRGDGTGGMLSLDMDPKLAWAVAHPEHFPVDLNTAARAAAAARARPGGAHGGAPAGRPPRAPAGPCRPGPAARAPVPRAALRLRGRPSPRRAAARPGTPARLAVAAAVAGPPVRMTAVGTAHRTVVLQHPADWQGFRAGARACLHAGMAPEQVAWQVVGAVEDDLFGTADARHAAGGAHGAAPPSGPEGAGGRPARPCMCRGPSWRCARAPACTAIRPASPCSTARSGAWRTKRRCATTRWTRTSRACSAWPPPPCGGTCTRCGPSCASARWTMAAPGRCTWPGSSRTISSCGPMPPSSCSASRRCDGHCSRPNAACTGTAPR